MTELLDAVPWAAAEDGVQNLRGPYGLSVIVWRLARKHQLVALGVPSDQVTRIRQRVTGSTRPGRRSQWVLATGMWGCNTAEEIAAATGISLARVQALAAAPIRRNVPRPGERLSQVILAGLAHRLAASPVRAGATLRIPTLDAFLLARRMSWFLEIVTIDLDQFWQLPTSDLDALWREQGLHLRVTEADVRAAVAVLGKLGRERR